jgi:hypothetical protein
LNLLLCAFVVPLLFWDRGPETADLLKQAGVHHIAVPAAMSARWKGVAGMTAESVDPQQLTKLPPPGVKFQRGMASATRAPWVDSNAWRFFRNPQATYFYDASGKSALLAAAESFAYGVRAFIHTDDAGLKPLANMLQFLEKTSVPESHPLTNIGYIDDGSPQSGELMNLLVRRNLLFRLVPKPDPSLNITVKLGMPEYPMNEAANPSLLAEKVRSNLGDSRRILRVYGSEVVVGRLVSAPAGETLFLINYGANRVPVDGIRVRVLGKFSGVQVRDTQVPAEHPLDTANDSQAIEFTLKQLGVFAIASLAH